MLMCSSSFDLCERTVFTVGTVRGACVCIVLTGLTRGATWLVWRDGGCWLIGGRLRSKSNVLRRSDVLMSIRLLMQGFIWTLCREIRFVEWVCC